SISALHLRLLASRPLHRPHSFPTRRSSDLLRTKKNSRQSRFISYPTDYHFSGSFCDALCYPTDCWTRDEWPHMVPGRYHASAWWSVWRFCSFCNFLTLVTLGLHQGLVPLHLDLIENFGSTMLLPILAMAGGGQVGAAFAIYLKTKDNRLKKTVSNALPVGILGIGEPLIYGVVLPLG